jgi:hypothetical protein
MVSSAPVTIDIEVDTTRTVAEINAVKAQADATVAAWKADRAIIVSQMQEVSRGIQYLVRGIRLAAQATGTVLDPMQNALLSLVSSTASMIISTAIAIEVSSFGLLTGVALALAAFAYGMEIANTAKIITNFAALQKSLIKVDSRLSAIEQGNLFRGMMGGAI